jgi:hypothetical protein
MLGGSILSSTNAEMAFGIIANDNAKVRLSGGRIDAISGSSGADFDLTVNGLSRLVIVGDDFNWTAPHWHYDLL